MDEFDSDLIPNVSNLDIVMDSVKSDMIPEHFDDIMIDPDWIPDKDDSNMNISEDVDVSLTSEKNKMDENEVKIRQEIEEDGVHTDAANTRAVIMPDKSNVSIEKIEHKKPKRSCLFCKKEQSQLRRHLRIKHKNEPEIRAIEKLPLKARAEAYDKLRKKAIFAINQQRMKSNEPLIRERDQGDGELAMCTYCRGFYSYKYFYRHLKQCHAREETTSPVSKQDIKYIKAKTKAHLSDKTLRPFETEIVTNFKMDETGNICRTDKMIQTYGEKEWYSSGQKNKQSVMSNMRSLANLLIEFRKQEENEDLSGEDMLDRTKFQSLEASIRNLTEDCNGEEKSAQKLKLGYAIKSAAKSMAGLYGMEEDTELVIKHVKGIEMFMFVLEHNWGKIFVSAQKKLAQRRAEVLRKPHELPVEDDMMKLKIFVEAEIAELVKDPYNTWGQYEYNRLRSMVLTRLTLYNARRGGEPARLTLNEWESAKNKEWVDPSLVSKIDDPIEKHLAGQYLLAHQPGKGGRTLVPLLIPNNIVAAINKIVEIREDAGVAKNNPYLFANTQGSMEHCRGWDAVHEVTKAANLNQPSKVTATSVRHRASTYYALLDVSRAERVTFLKHMGHSEEVSNNIYTTPSSYMELCKVGRFFEALDDGHLNPASSVTTASLPHTKNNSGFLQVSSAEKNPSLTCSLHDEKHPCPSFTISKHEQTLAKVSRKCTQAKKVMWKAEDEVKVMDYFHTNLVTDVVPNKKQVDAFFALNPHIAESCNGNWRRIKYKVYNEIVRRKNLLQKKSFK